MEVGTRWTWIPLDRSALFCGTWKISHSPIAVSSGSTLSRWMVAMCRQWSSSMLTCSRVFHSNSQMFLNQLCRRREKLSHPQHFAVCAPMESGLLVATLSSSGDVAVTIWIRWSAGDRAKWIRQVACQFWTRSNWIYSLANNDVRYDVWKDYNKSAWDHMRLVSNYWVYCGFDSLIRFLKLQCFEKWTDCDYTRHSHVVLLLLNRFNILFDMVS